MSSGRHAGEAAPAPSGGVTKTYYVVPSKDCASGLPLGAAVECFGTGFILERKKNGEYLFTVAVTAQGGGIERYNIHS